MLEHTIGHVVPTAMIRGVGQMSKLELEFV